MEGAEAAGVDWAWADCNPMDDKPKVEKPRVEEIGPINSRMVSSRRIMRGTRLGKANLRCILVLHKPVQRTMSGI